MIVHDSAAPTTGVWGRCMVASLQAEVSQKAPRQNSENGVGGVARYIRTTPLVACETVFDFPPMDHWIRKMAFNKPKI